MDPKKPIVISAIQATGNLHIGNYLGAVKNWVVLQESGLYDCYFFIADYHSLTGDMDHATRYNQIMRTATDLLAAGIDPTKSTLFVQSAVPAHTELAWVFNCVTPVAELYRMTQFKDKSERQESNINSGLLTYPMLMAADILLYHATLVPVGQDQVQHVELTRDIARWFNNRYGNYFVETKALLTDIPKVMSLLEPDKKMSKSKGPAHIIELADEPEVIEAKLKKAVTATTGGQTSLGVDNLLLLLKHFGDGHIYEEFVSAEHAGTIRYADLKQALAEAMGKYFSDFRAKRSELLQDVGSVERLLEIGATKARAAADTTMTDVRKIIGLRR